MDAVEEELLEKKFNKKLILVLCVLALIFIMIDFSSKKIENLTEVFPVLFFITHFFNLCIVFTK